MTHHHHHHGGSHSHRSVEMRRRAIAGNVVDWDNHPINGHEDEKTQLQNSAQFPNAGHALIQRDEVTQTVTAVVATAIDVIIESGSTTLTQLTVSSLPTVVSVSGLGIVTIPAATSSSDAVTNTAATTAGTVDGINHQIPIGSSTSTSTQSTALHSSSTQSAQSESSASSATLAPTATTSSSTETQSPTSESSTPSLTSATSTSETSNPNTSTFTSSFSSTTESSSSSTSVTSYSSTTSPSTTFFSTTSSTISIHSTSTGTQLPGSSSTGSSSSSGSSNDAGKIAGGVVGGVLGLLLIFLLAFLLFRYRKRQAQSTASSKGGGLASKGMPVGGSASRSAEMTSHRSSDAPIAAAAALGHWKSSSSNTTGERGFQKISGRKIPSVLHTGGDGYGDEIEEETVPEMPSSPLDATSPVSPSSAFGGGANYRHPPMRDDFITGAGLGEGIAVMRQSPARTPTASTVDLNVRGSSQRGVSPLRPDSIGRTLSRYDGSRSSRFTEGI